jgi:signal transduction histidine kinase
VKKHAEARTVRIAVRREDDRAVLEVRDDGRGMTRESAPVGPDGSHMGMEILLSLVHDAGGTLTVTSGDAGVGTVVRVELVVA